MTVGKLEEVKDAILKTVSVTEVQSYCSDNGYKIPLIEDIEEAINELRKV